MRRLGQWALTLLVAMAMASVLLLYLGLAVRGDFPGLVSDYVVYLYHADFFASASPSRDSSAFVFGYNFPPLYGVWLALLGGSTVQITQALVANSLAYLLLGIAFVTLAMRYSADRRAALLGALLFLLAPEILIFSRNLASEGLFTALSLLALAALARPRPSVTELRLAAGLVMLAILTRTAGIALIPALAAAFIRARKIDVLALVVLLAPIGAWSALHSMQSAQLRDAYASSLADVTVSSLVANMQVLAAAWRDFWGLTTVPGLDLIISVLVLLGAVLLAIWGTLRLDSLAIYLMSYAAMVILWPYPAYAHRFLIPWLPIAIVVLLVDIRGMKRLIGARVILAGLLMLAMAGSWRVAGRSADTTPQVPDGLKTAAFYLAAEDPVVRVRKGEIVDGIRAVAQQAGRIAHVDDCVLTTYVELFHLYAKIPARRIAGGAQWRDVEPLLEECRYAFGLVWTSDVNANAYHPLSLQTQAFAVKAIDYTSEGIESAVFGEYVGRAQRGDPP